MHQNNTAGSRWPGIDVLRGLSVLLVVLHHIHLRFVLNRYDVATLVPKPVGQALFWSGYYAVIAFFVISGFLITNLSIRRWGSLEQINAKQFYALRVARIAPCLLLLLAVLSALHLFGTPDFVIKPERSSLGRALLAALTFHINWLEGTRGYLPGSWDVLWSLSIEETFYLAFPLVCLLLRSERLLVMPLLLLIVVGPFYRVAVAEREPWNEYAYLACMDGIAFGCLAALISARWCPSRAMLRFGLTVGIALSALVIAFRNQVREWGITDLGLHITLLELGVALILIALANDVGAKLLSRGTGWLQAIGRSSYEIYLTHMFAVLGLMQLFKLTKPSAPTIPLWYLSMLLASIVLGYAVSRYYSEPANSAIRSRAYPSTGVVGVASVS